VVGREIHVGEAVAVVVFALVVVLICLSLVVRMPWVISCQLGPPNMDVHVSPAHEPGPNVSPRYEFRRFSGFGECAFYFYEGPHAGE